MASVSAEVDLELPKSVLCAWNMLTLGHLHFKWTLELNSIRYCVSYLFRGSISMVQTPPDIQK